ncbi:MAG: hypothetical protein ACFCVD_24805 [Nodosilinea sp.]
MKFDRDIFISYAHIDNQALTEDLGGWVSILHRGLDIRLGQLRGEQPNIWRDLKLSGNDVFSDTILEQFPNLAVLVSILSPRYVKSEWCLRELEHFYTAAGARGGVKIGDKHRIFKIIKTFLPREKHPQPLGQLLGYEFYDTDESGRPREFSKLYGPESERKFWAKLDDLAYDIHQTLEILEALPEGSDANDASQATAATLDGKVIYLAETTSDLTEARAKIRRELEQAGHKVLPVAPLPDPPAFTQTVREALAQAALSVHLLSPAPIRQVSTTEQTLDEAYQQIAVLRSRDQVKLADQYRQEHADFSRILWMPPGAENLHLDEFIQALQNDTDLISTNLESLKDIIHDRLLHPPQPAGPALALDGTVQLYLDCDERDLETSDIEPLYAWLEQHFRVVLPDYEANGVARSETLLKQCEAVLIYYGQASSLWLKRRLLALKKTLYGRPRPLLAKAVYMADPSKQRFSDPEVPIIEGFSGFSPDLLNVFLEQLG